MRLQRHALVPWPKYKVFWKWIESQGIISREDRRGTLESKMYKVWHTFAYTCYNADSARAAKLFILDGKVRSLSKRPLACFSSANRSGSSIRWHHRVRAFRLLHRWSYHSSANTAESGGRRRHASWRRDKDDARAVQAPECKTDILAIN